MKFMKNDIVAIKGTDGSEKRGVVDGIYGNICPMKVIWDDGTEHWFHEDGRHHFCHPPILTLIERPPRKEKRKVKGFVNVYRDSESVHDSSYLARAAARGREAIAVAVPFETEIEFEVKQQPGDEPKEERDGQKQEQSGRKFDRTICEDN